MEGDPRSPADDDDFQTPDQVEKPAVARRTVAEERALRAYELRVTKGLTWKQIGERLDCPPSTAKSAYDRGRMMLIPKQDVETAKEIALEKLDYIEQAAWAMHDKSHPMVSFGKLVPGVEDDGPKKAALEVILKVEAMRQKIVGYLAPSKRVLEVVNEDKFDEAIRALNEQAAELERQAQLQLESEAESVIEGGMPPMGE